MMAGISSAFPVTDGAKMVGTLLLRGMLVGLFAALLAFGFARVVAEPQVDRAISLEAAAPSEAMSHGDQHHHEAEMFSRGTQAGVGLLTGLAVYGTAMGGLLALVFAFVHGRVSQIGPRGTSALIALGAFVAIVMVPGIKYPANPPAVGNGETIGMRTELFFMMLLLSVFALMLAVALARRLWASQGAWTALLVGAVAYVLAMVLVQRALPAINEVPDGFPADLLWNFRLAALGLQAILWAVIGLGFGALAERAMTPDRPLTSR